jgi:hypothetical protein
VCGISVRWKCTPVVELRRATGPIVVIVVEIWRRRSVRRSVVEHSRPVDFSRVRTCCGGERLRPVRGRPRLAPGGAEVRPVVEVGVEIIVRRERAVQEEFKS